MVNNSPNTKLDEAVKNALKDFEVQYDQNDWSRMDNMLNAAPKQTQFNWKYTLNIIIGITLIGGGYLLYKQFSKPSENKVEIVAPIPEKTKPATTPVPKPFSKPLSAPIVAPVSEPVLEKAVVENKIDTKETKTPLTQAASAKEKAKTKDIKTPLKTDNDKTNTKIHPIIRMGNEPIFGDMLDSSRGVIGTTQEKEETKKAAKTQSNKNIGWDNIMFSNVNPDSIRKHRESMKKDTLKN
jgi:hypothetical protein